MRLVELDHAVCKHGGEFLCEQRGGKEGTKRVPFRHMTTAPGSQGIPAVGRLQDFYDTFGSVLFYYDEDSEDAARYLAPPDEWDLLRENFLEWIDILDEEDREEALPEGLDGYLVIGETPRSGNYILVVRRGRSAGQVIEFDHDGFEVTPMADDVVDYVERLLVPDTARLTDFASHMCFTEGDSRQWWITEMRDNRGRVVRTRT